MAPSIYRTAFLNMYREFRDPDMFLSGFFPVRKENISNTETVSIDIVRTDEEISPVVNAMEGPTYNSEALSTNKEFTPPSIEEAMTFNAKDLLHRMPGGTEYQASDVGFQEQLVTRMLTGINLLEGKIRRNREWQASQILQTGMLTLVDAKGNPAYVIDFKPKVNHFVSAGTAWNAGGADPLADIEALSDTIRDTSLQDANRLIMGAGTINAFINNDIVKAQMDNKRYEIGHIAPKPAGKGGKFWGIVNVGNYQFEIWSFNGRGLVPGAASKTLFVDDDSCIVMSSDGRLDTVFAGVPVPVRTDERFRDFLPSRVAIPRAVDVAPNIYNSLNGRETMLELASRPLLIPTAIDSFGTISTGV
jgi:hypothetical protein